MCKTAIVTGAGDGIGKAIALRLAKDGFNVVVNDLDESSAIMVCDEIKEMGKKSLSVIVDVSDEEVINKTIEEFGSIDVLVNNAGFCPVRLMKDVNVEDFKRTMDINLTSIFMA